MNKNKNKKIVNIILISIINILFTFKYLGRLNNKIILITGLVAFCILPFVLYVFSKFANSKEIFLFENKIKIFNNRYVLGLTLSILLTISSIIFFVVYPQNRLNIDRYEMIDLFWDNFLCGKCPYCPRTIYSNIPGPFPFYFYISLPFYLIGEIGLLPLISVLAFVFLMHSNKKNITYGNMFFVIILFFSSPAVLYEIFTRSTIFFNSLIFLIFCICIINIKKNHKIIPVLLTGLLSGLLLSTRTVFLVFLLMFMVFLCKEKIAKKNILSILSIALLAFLFTFLPVFLICKREFFLYNPFVVQSTLAPIFFVIPVTVLSVIISYFIKEENTFYFFCGIVFFIFFIGHWLTALNYGFFKSLIEGIDISYSCFSLPFLFYSLLSFSQTEIENDRKCCCGA